MGSTWGLSFSLARVAATGGAHPLGIAFWECSIAGLLLVCLIAGRRIPVRVSRRDIRLHLTTGLVGMVIPGAAFFYAAAHVPAGVLSITIGMVPIMTFVASAFIRLEKFEMRRVFGVVLGSVSVVLLVAPNGSLPDPAQWSWLLLGFAAAGCYSALSLVIVLLAPPKSNSLVLTCGMFIAATFLMIPVLYVTGSFAPFGWPWGAVEWSMLGLGIINAVAYALYFSLVDRAGPVFSSFTANLVTLFGVFWGIVIFAEENSVWVWLSFLTIMGALALVTPRGRAAAKV